VRCAGCGRRGGCAIRDRCGVPYGFLPSPTTPTCLDMRTANGTELAPLVSCLLSAGLRAAPESVCDAAVAELPTSAPGPAASAPEPVGSKVELADPHGISLSFEVDGPSPSEESALRHRANGTHAPLLQNSSAVPSATHETRTTRAKYSSSTVVPEPITRTPARLEGYSDSLRPSPGGVAGTAAAISAAEGRARIVAQARAGLQQRSQRTPLRQPIDDPGTAEIGRYM
jgi:hypothetical protein